MDTLVEAGTSYVYRVKARNSAGLSERSSFFDAGLPAAPDSTTELPDPPTNLTAIAAGETLVVLSWAAPEGADASSILGYRIEVSADGGTNWTDLAANTGNTMTTHAHTDLAPGATRHYRVSAINSAGTGAPSNVASATTADRTPPRLTLGAVGATGDTLEPQFNEALDLGAGKTSPMSAERRGGVHPPGRRSRHAQDQHVPGRPAHQASTARTTHSVTGARIGIGVIPDGVQTLVARQASTVTPPRGM